VAVDFGALLRRLVVSEQVIIKSVGLRELPVLVAKFGYDGVKALLESGRVWLLCESMMTGDIGKYSDRTNGPVLPAGSYWFSALRFSPTKEMLSATAASDRQGAWRQCEAGEEAPQLGRWAFA
jgi:hypothetical protein